MKSFRITIDVIVDPVHANFLTVLGNDREDIAEVVHDALWDIDDLEIVDIKVEE